MYVYIDSRKPVNRNRILCEYRYELSKNGPKGRWNYNPKKNVNRLENRQQFTRIILQKETKKMKSWVSM